MVLQFTWIIIINMYSVHCAQKQSEKRDESIHETRCADVYCISISEHIPTVAHIKDAKSFCHIYNQKTEEREKEKKTVTISR